MAKLTKYSKCTAYRYADLVLLAVAAAGAVVVIVKTVKLVKGLITTVKLTRLAGAVVSLACNKR